MNYLLQDLRALMRRNASGHEHTGPHECVRWSVHGLQRRTIVCDPVQLMELGELSMVGFFGDRRIDVDTVRLDEVEEELLNEFRNYPGILSYSSAELVDNHWANLVVHKVPSDREAWRSSAVHTTAAQDLAPQVYRSVRIHNGLLPSGVIGSDPVVLETTKYWDYASDPPWRALRQFAATVTS